MNRWSFWPLESIIRCSEESSHRNVSARLNLPPLDETSPFNSSSSSILSCRRRRCPIIFFYSNRSDLLIGSILRRFRKLPIKSGISNPKPETSIRSLFFCSWKPRNGFRLKTLWGKKGGKITRAAASSSSFMFICVFSSFYLLRLLPRHVKGINCWFW